MAFPDTFVTMSDEWICRVLPLVGLGTREYIKAGHSAMVLIENATGKANYYDFGRYITPKGHGRVRSAETDAELKIPFKASMDSAGQLTNLDRFLGWLDAHPEKTHGQGRLLASVCEAIDYEKAHKHILALQSRGSIPYGAFHKQGSNCSRFVTDTILAATDSSEIQRGLNFNKKFTPSTVGNVEKAATDHAVYEVFQGEVKLFEGTAFKENLRNYFDKKNPNASNGIAFAEPSDRKPAIGAHAQYLSGTGSGAWFELSSEQLPAHHYRIKRYSDSCELDFDGVYVSKEFDATLPYQFTYDSHCSYCHVLQNNQKLKLELLARYAEFNSLQKVHSA